MHHSHPDIPPEFLQRLQKLFPNDAETQSYFFQEKKQAVRVNTLRCSPDDAVSIFSTAGISAEQVAWYPAAFQLSQQAVTSLMQLPEYQAGLFYLQNLSSMIPALELDPQPGERVLDLTAAPGSKTTQLATLMHNSGEILANDLSRARVFRLRANLEQQGVTNTITRVGPGELLWQHFPEQFDKVLIDAPCSMEGRFTVSDSESYSDWSLKKIKKLARRQQFLLRSAFSATKPGGTVVYSTCTLAPEENEAVVQWLLEKEQDAAIIEPGTVQGIPTTPGLQNWGDAKFDPHLTQTIRVKPSAEYEGFYLAKIKKTRTTVLPW